MTPVLMPDGSLLTQGYQDGVFVAPSCDHPAIPDRRTREDAVAALNEFEQDTRINVFRSERRKVRNGTRRLPMLAFWPHPSVLSHAPQSPQSRCSRGSFLLVDVKPNRTVNQQFHAGRQNYGNPLQRRRRVRQTTRAVPRAGDRIVSIEKPDTPAFF